MVGGLMIVAVALASAAAAQQGTPPGSQLIAALERDVATGRGEAVAAFWCTVESRSTPIVEPVPGD